jgi:SMC interacting uncharacterized protein involved in chromosome segregation
MAKNSFSIRRKIMEKHIINMNETYRKMYKYLVTMEGQKTEAIANVEKLNNELDELSTQIKGLQRTRDIKESELKNDLEFLKDISTATFEDISLTWED